MYLQKSSSLFREEQPRIAITGSIFRAAVAEADHVVATVF
jgi:hypothetical protein